MRRKKEQSAPEAEASPIGEQTLTQKTRKTTAKPKLKLTGTPQNEYQNSIEIVASPIVTEQTTPASHITGNLQKSGKNTTKKKTQIKPSALVEPQPLAVVKTTPIRVTSKKSNAKEIPSQLVALPQNDAEVLSVKQANPVVIETKSTEKKATTAKTPVSKTTSSTRNRIAAPIQTKDSQLEIPNTVEQKGKIELPVAVPPTEKKSHIPKGKPKAGKGNTSSTLKKTETTQTAVEDVSKLSSEKVPPHVLRPAAEEPFIPIGADEAMALRLQEIEQRYGGETPKKPNKKQQSKPINKAESQLQQIKEIVPDLPITQESEITENEEDTPKLSYWQQRRLQKKLKQKLQRELEGTATPISTEVRQSPPLRVADQILPVAKSVELPAPPHTDSELESDGMSESTSEAEPPKLSYWQQRRLNKKLKQKQLREQQLLSENQDDSIIGKQEESELITDGKSSEIQKVIAPATQKESSPQVQKHGVHAAKQKQLPTTAKTEKSKDKDEITIPIANQKDDTREFDKTESQEQTDTSLLTANSEEPQKLSYWQHRRLQRKLKKQQLQQEAASSSDEADTKPAEGIANKGASFVEPVSDERVVSGKNDPQTVPTTSETEPKKLSYWQQKRLQKKLRQQQEMELISANQGSDIEGTTTVDSIDVATQVPARKILPVPPDKVLPPKEKKILPVPADKALAPQGKKILPVPPDKVLPPKDKKEIPVREKKILPVPADKVLPQKEKKILPVPPDKVLPKKDKKAEPTTEKKILPVPADKVLHPKERKVLPVPERTEKPLVDLMALKHPPKPPKPQFPKRPKPPLPALPPELYLLVERTEKYMFNELNAHSDSTILLTVSGGVDSMVMLDILAYISLKHNLLLHVAHCNHHLRGNDSMEDEKLVRRAAANYGFHFHHTSLKVEEFATRHKLSIEQAARTLRYQFFERMAKTAQAELVATAHTADDCAETFLLNLLRGTGLTGLAGIPARRELTKKIHIIRPLLMLTKSELYNYANVRGLHWREDVSNTSLLYTRNKVRLQLLPSLKEQFSPAVVEILNRTARLLHGADELITEKADAMMPKLLRSIDKSTFALSIPYFDSVNDFMKGEILQKILLEKYQSLPVSMHTIDRIIALTQSQIGAVCEITSAVSALRERTEIVFQRNEVQEEIDYLIGKISELKTESFHLILKEIPRKEVQFSENPNIEFFDADLLPLWLTFRNWQNGDRIQPLGMNGTMTVGNFLTNEKVSLIDKKKSLVLCAGNEVVWLCSRRASDKFKVTASTKRVIRLEFTPKTPQLTK